MTVRDYISQWQDEVLNAVNLNPHRAADLLNKSAALMGNVCDTILERQVDYNRKLAELSSDSPVAKAKIIADTTPEYINMMEAKNAEKCLIELIRALKYYLRVYEDEKESSFSQ